MIQELQNWGFRFEVVLADSLYEESSDFVSTLEQLHLKYVVAIRSNHGVWLPKGSTRALHETSGRLNVSSPMGSSTRASSVSLSLGSAGTSATTTSRPIERSCRMLAPGTS